LAVLLSTLIQHYGLDSPVLDLTDSLDVALFFATHQFGKTGSRHHYEWVGTNNRKAVIYVLRQDSREMQPYQSHERVVRQLNPLRPKRQRCIVSRSGPYALNLPAYFVKGVILMDFDGAMPNGIPAPEYLFPSDAEDFCLRALKSNPFAGNHLTDFHGVNSSPNPSS